MLQTDHEPLKYMNSAKFSIGSLMRWTMSLQNYNFRVEAIKGSENVGADYLSRAGITLETLEYLLSWYYLSNFSLLVEI